MNITILKSDHQDELAEQLSAAWGASTTFACIPGKASVSPEAVDAALAALPLEQRTDHMVMLTSGSTGEPKFIVGSRSRAQALARELHIVQSSEVVAHTVAALPLSYTYAFVNQFVWSQTHARRLVLTEGLADPGRLEHALDHTSDAMLCLVGAQVPLLLRHWGRRRFAGVVRLHFAGGRFPQDSLDALEAMFPHASIFNNYGCAEAMPRLTIRQARSAQEASDIGRPLRGIELRSSVDGALEFRSAYQAVGVVQYGVYRSINDSDWTPTGDLGEQLAGGNWRLKGRRSEVFKRFGEKVSLASLLDSIKGVWSGEAVFVVTQPPEGADPAHTLVLSPPPSGEDLRKVLQCLRAGFSRAQWPVQIIGADSIPTLATGKPDVAALARRSDLPTLWRQRI